MFQNTQNSKAKIVFAVILLSSSSLVSAGASPRSSSLNVTGAVQALAFSPDGSLLAVEREMYNQGSTPYVDEVQLWNVRAKILSRTLQGTTTGGSGFIVFSPDSRTLATPSGRSGVKLWDVRRGIVTRTLAFKMEIVYSASFAPDGKILVGLSLDG